MQAAINASLADLPSDLPSLPRFRKANPAASPVFVLALTSKTISTSAMYDVADTVIAQRISQVPGVGEVTVSGADQPAVRIALNPVALSNAGIATDDVRLAIIDANPLGPVGIFNGGRQSETLSTNRQMRTAAEFRDIMIKSSNGNFVRLSDVAEVEDSVRNSRSIAWFNKQPAVLIQITKQGDANVIDTVDRVRALIPELKQWIPAGVEISTLVDRTGTIRASVLDMQWTLLATAFLVMVVVFVFLRRITPTIAAGVSVPLALAGTCAGMWLAGFSIDNLSLMALAISVGFVVDDAIVMIENMYRNLEQGMPPYPAALEGAKQIGFTVLSISLSLIAAFTPLIFMDGIVGRLLREFSLTLTFAIVVSTVVSLTITPMICAHYIKTATSDNATWFDRAVEGTLSRIVRFYTRTLRVVLGFPFLTLIVFFATIALTVMLYIKTPKGYFPVDDSGFVIGATRASPDISFQAMLKLQQQLADIVMADPAVAGIGSTLGGGGGPGGGGSNRGTMFISLKPPEERGGADDRAGDRPAAPGSLPRRRHPPVHVRGAGYPRRRPAERFRLSVHAVQHRSRSAAEMGADRRQAHGDGRGHHRHFRRPRSRRAAADADDRPQDRLQPRRSRPGHRQRAQQRVFAAADFDHLHPAQPVHGGAGDRSEIPGRSVQPRTHLRRRRQWRAGAAVGRGAHQRGLSPLAVFHSQSFPSTTVSFNLLPDVPLEVATTNIQRAVDELHMPEGIRGSFDGNAGDFNKTSGRQPLLILGALVAMYIVLGVLYESLAHPLTIISTLPSAGLGALLALQMTNTPLTVIAFVGIILLIGIVKKNGIMMVDFALDAERHRGLSSADAIFEACSARFRPILMTTMAALFAGIPLVIATGPGTELRRPLGITIIGGLFVSQILTLYTTPVIYLLIDRLRRRRSEPRAVAAPAE